MNLVIRWFFEIKHSKVSVVLPDNNGFVMLVHTADADETKLSCLGELAV